jgi:phosphocarrier protein HPr
MSSNGSTSGMGVSGPLRRTVVVANPNGLHMRPATLFAQKARGFRAIITVWCDEKRADGKSSLDLILLTALPGAKLVLEVDGDDADDALELLATLLESTGDEEE